MNKRAFTLVELLTVITIIAVLAGLILMGSGFAQKKAASERAKTEMQAMSAACESYKADNGIYPRDSTTDLLDAKTVVNPASYQSASLYLYKQLSGDTDADANRSVDANAKAYMDFKRDMLSPSGGIGAVKFIQDPFGFSYGYSTIYQANSEKPTPANPAPGYNPTFDMWSTAGTSAGTAAANQPKWLTNW